MVDTSANVPDIRTPFLNQATGQIDPVWWQFLIQLFVRTGSEAGIDPNGDHAAVIKLQALVDTLQGFEFSMAPIQDITRTLSDTIFALIQEVPLLAPKPSLELGFIAAHGIQTDPLLHAQVTQLFDGFMIAADKAKLDGITGGAAVSSVSGAAPIASSGGTTPVISISPATGSAAGSLSAADKAKLDTVGANANVTSVAGRTGVVTLTSADVGLGNVNNTTDLNKPISTATQTALNTKVTNPMTTAGDLIVGGAAGAPIRLPIGTAGQVLTVVSGTESWQTVAAAPITAINVTAPITSTGGSTPNIGISSVTTSANGAMLATDKVKLDGITTGAAVASVTGTAPIASSGGATPAISITPATTSLPGSMSAADKAKLDTLGSSIVTVSLTADVTTTNSTADAAILSMTAPANSLSVGSVITMDIVGNIPAATLAATLAIWVKVGSTKAVICNIVMPANFSAGVLFKAQIICTIRPSSLIQMTCDVQCAQGTYAQSVYVPNPFSAASSTAFTLTASNTLTAGFNWSVAGVSNTATARNCVIAQQK